MYTDLNILLIAVDLVFVLLFSWYKGILKRGVFTEIKSVIIQNLIVWGASMTVLFMEKNVWDLSRTVFVTGILFPRYSCLF